MLHQENGKSFLRVDSPVPLLHSIPSDLGSLILFRIIAKECLLRLFGEVYIVPFSFNCSHIHLVEASVY